MDIEDIQAALPTTDRALIRAFRAWAVADDPATFRHFRPQHRDVLVRSARFIDEDPHSALDHLRWEHAAQARPDFARVHTSWWSRAMKGEPLSVRQAVVDGLPADLGEALAAELGMERRPVGVEGGTEHPGALRVSLALWSERLVGDVPERDDDPPVILALTRFDARATAHLIQATGQAKQALATESARPSGEGLRSREDRFRSDLAGVDRRLADVAGRDLAALAGASSPELRLGLTTFARLLGAVEPYRGRWALQHLPYATARAIRALTAAFGHHAPMLASWEAEVLRVAWVVLHEEGRLDEPWPRPAEARR